MSKYKKINEGIVDKFIEKLFTNVGKKASSTALKTLADKDPQFKKKICCPLCSFVATTFCLIGNVTNYHIFAP